MGILQRVATEVISITNIYKLYYLRQDSFLSCVSLDGWLISAQQLSSGTLYWALNMNVVKLEPSARRGDAITLQFKVECYQKVFREWGEYLDLYEQTALLQIIDRTIGWGRREAYFTNRSLLDGDMVYAGVPMGRTKLFEALASLEKKGVITRRQDAVKPDRVHFTVNVEWSPDVTLSGSKRLQPVAKSSDRAVRVADGGVRITDGGVRHADPIYSSPLTGSPNSNHPGATAPVSLDFPNRVREGDERGQRAHRAVLQRKATGPQALAASIESAFRLAQIDAFPDTSYKTWGVREKAQVKTAAKGWRGAVPFPEFVEWAVRNWTAILSKQFRWMTKVPPPATPALGFFIAFIGQFEECHAEGKLEAWLSDLDRTQHELFVGRGMTYEQASAEVARRKAIAATRDEMKIREVTVRARERMVDHKLKQAEQLADFAGTAPVHPRSRAAQELRREVGKPASIVPPPGEDKPEFTGAVVAFVDPKRNPFDDPDGAPNFQRRHQIC